MHQGTKAYLLASAAVLSWSTIGTAFKLTLSHADPFQMEMFSIPMAVLITALAVTLEGNWRQVRMSTPGQLLHSAVLGLMNPFLYYIVMLNAYDLLLTQEATTLNFTWPMVLVFLSALVLKQKLSLMSLAALFLGFMGAVVIATKGSLTSLRITHTGGFCLALGSTIIWASFFIFNAKDKRDPAVKLLLNFSFALPWALGAWLIFSDPKIPAWQGLLGSFYMGIFELAVPFLLWLKALALSRRTADVANLIFLTPFLALFWIRLILKESIHVSTVLALFLIVAGIMLQRKSQKQPT